MYNILMPTEAHRGPQRPTEAHRGPQRPTEAHRGSQRPTEAHRGPQRPTESENPKSGFQWSHAGGVRVNMVFGLGAKIDQNQAISLPCTIFSVGL